MLDSMTLPPYNVKLFRGSPKEGEGRVRAAYGVNYERLVTLKNTYDPTNFFALNQNIKPLTPCSQHYPVHDLPALHLPPH